MLTVGLASSGPIPAHSLLKCPWKAWDVASKSNACLKKQCPGKELGTGQCVLTMGSTSTSIFIELFMRNSSTYTSVLELERYVPAVAVLVSVKNSCTHVTAHVFVFTPKRIAKHILFYCSWEGCFVQSGHYRGDQSQRGLFVNDERL